MRNAKTPHTQVQQQQQQRVRYGFTGKDIREGVLPVKNLYKIKVFEREKTYARPTVFKKNVRKFRKFQSDCDIYECVYKPIRTYPMSVVPSVFQGAGQFENLRYLSLRRHCTLTS